MKWPRRNKLNKRKGSQELKREPSSVTSSKKKSANEAQAIKEKDQKLKGKLYKDQKNYNWKIIRIKLYN
jgi:hypothetical protein